MEEKRFLEMTETEMLEISGGESIFYKIGELAGNVLYYMCNVGLQYMCYN